MSNADLGNVERQVLRTLRERQFATVEQLAELLPATGASSVVEANAELAKNRLVEPVPGVTGALRLTAAGSELAADLPDREPDPNASGGGDSTFN
jgi:Mn-dependent DtxR family transcriptional regulator